MYKRTITKQHTYLTLIIPTLLIFHWLLLLIYPHFNFLDHLDFWNALKVCVLDINASLIYCSCLFSTYSTEFSSYKVNYINGPNSLSCVTLLIINYKKLVKIQPLNYMLCYIWVKESISYERTELKIQSYRIL